MKFVVEICDDDLAALAQRVADNTAFLPGRPQRRRKSDRVLGVSGCDIHKSLVQTLVNVVVEHIKPMVSDLQPRSQRASAPSSSPLTRERRKGEFPERGYIRLKDVLAVIPVSKSSWWAGIRKGRFPRPTKKFGPRIAAWAVKDIRALLERGVD